MIIDPYPNGKHIPRPHSVKAKRFKGVCHLKSGRWLAKITVKGKQISLRTHATEEDAAKAYDKAALEYFGESAWLNFPPEPKEPIDPNACILWRGQHDKYGYGKTSVKGVMRLAHKVLWECENGPVPEGMCLDHLCCVKRCVNLNHLELVTPEENTKRAWKVRKATAQESSNG